MASKNLDEYIARMRAICNAVDSDTQRCLMLTSDHLLVIMDIIESLQKCVLICADQHNAGHQQQTLEMIDHIVRDMDNATEKRH